MNWSEPSPCGKKTRWPHGRPFRPISARISWTPSVRRSISWKGTNAICCSSGNSEPDRVTCSPSPPRALPPFSESGCWERPFICLRRNLLSRIEASALLNEQREWFRTTIGSIGDGVIATDVEGRVRIINRIAQELCGWNEDDALGKPLAEVFSIINEKTRKKGENPVANVLRSGKIVGLANHTALIAKDGVERSIADSAAPICDAQGRVTGVVLVFRDVTEGKRMQDALANLASFPTLNPSPIMEADFAGRIHYLNPALERLFPDLLSADGSISWMNDWDAFIRPLHEDESKSVAREIYIGEHCYQQTANYVRVTECVRIYGMDITLRKRAEERQAQERANLQAIFNVVNVGMLLIDESGAVQRVNDTVSRWIGKDLTDHLGMQPGGLVGCVHALNDPALCGRTAYCTLLPHPQYLRVGVAHRSARA